jgi:hypothetical protein
MGNDERRGRGSWGLGRSCEWPTTPGSVLLDLWLHFGGQVPGVHLGGCAQVQGRVAEAGRVRRDCDAHAVTPQPCHWQH